MGVREEDSGEKFRTNYGPVHLRSSLCSVTHVLTRSFVALGSVLSLGVTLSGPPAVPLLMAGISFAFLLHL